jgi:hypothetical protein
MILRHPSSEAKQRRRVAVREFNQEEEVGMAGFTG